ncbi:hypothetical protein [Desulfuromonas sp. AOP6]|uniref:hypothetical protein n=1 Tax=Desulfuromonas sp. AOP6 TaxID=1566351 RepID=UPI00128A5FB9|nr:hypothetical protein [Desulfuromonas sp. AOP6]BCA80722.1 hypothetical protein AOP6_2509 [Desulfuromonas sp. AOP6]
MKLEIAFECPQCQKSVAQNLNDYAPGTRRLCPSCGTDTILTPDGLQSFRASLESFCRPPH